MYEYRISLVGRARVGKSMLLTQFVKRPNEIGCLSNAGSDSTKIPTELILQSGNCDIEIKCIEKNGKSNELKIDELKDLHMRLRDDIEYRNKISHITIQAEPSDWVKRILEQTSTFRLVVVDTEGVSGNVEELNIRNWKSNLFILMFNSANNEDFAESMNKMKSALVGNNIWHCVSLQNHALTTYEDDLETDINDLEKDAIKVKNDFSNQLRILENKKSLLGMRTLDFVRRETVLAIPNIRFDKKQYENGRKYTNDKLEELLKLAIENDDTEIDMKINLSDTTKKEATNNFLQKLSSTSLYAVKNIEINGIRLNCLNNAFKNHLNTENRLKSYDRGYLIEKQWEIVRHLRKEVFDKLNDITFDPNLALNEEEQASIIQSYYSTFAKKVVWTNYFVHTTDGREGTVQASIILMLYSNDILDNMELNSDLKGILSNVIKSSSGWNKNYLNFKKASETIALELSGVEGKIENEFENFYKKIIKPYTIAAIYSMLLNQEIVSVKDVLNRNY